MTTVPAGTLLVSIDLPAADTGDSRAASMVGTHLMRTLEQLRIPATWAFGDPARSPGAARLSMSSLGHEIALLGDSSWVDARGGRSVFVRELSRRVEAARRIGLPVTSLSLSDTQLRKNLDVLVKQRITVVRSPLDSGEAGFVLPHALRFGVWEARPTICVPSVQRWWPATALAARWTLGKAVTAGAIAHLAIDVGRLEARDVAGLRLIARVLQYAARLRDEGLLRTKTLCHLSSRFQRRRRTLPQRSILRGAA